MACSPSVAFRSIAGVVAAAVGSYRMAEGLWRSYSVSKIVTGGSAVTAATVLVEGSLDGSNWFTIATLSATATESASVADRPAKFVRANLTTLTATANPTVDVYVAAID